MRKVLTFLGVSLCLTWVVAARAQNAAFQDVPRDHWAYEAVEDLRSKGILKGYPDGFFRGKRTLTRYEFAVALDRLLKSIPPGQVGPPGPAGPTGPAGATGPQGPPGLTPEELNTIRRLLNEFRNELTALGNNMRAINQRLDRLEKDMADVKDQLSKMPKIGGGVWVGVRADRANGGYVDKDGRVQGIGDFGGSGLVHSPQILHDFLLTVDAKIAGGATVSAALSTDNYKNFLGGNYAIDAPAINRNPASDTYIDLLEVHAPISGIGRGSNLTIGRYAHRISRLTLWRPDVDSYLDVPWENDGNYRIDGARLTTHFGSVFLEAFGGQTKSVSGSNSLGLNSPLAGIPPSNNGQIFFGGKPIGQLVGPGGFFGFGPLQGQMVVDQLFGLSGGIDIRQLKGGHIRLTAIDTDNLSRDIGPGGPASFSGGSFAGAGFNNVWILGADADLTVADRLTFNAEYSKTITGTSRFHTNPGTQDNAFDARLGYQIGALNVTAGYRYIDPLFYAPGYWGRIGNWINPTNIQGPTFRAAYDFTPNIGLTVGGDFYSAARNRAGNGGLSMSDDINRVLAGLRWNLSKTFLATVDWEGVYWSLSGARLGLPGLAGTVHPTEQYVTIGTGLHLTDSTILKLSYQVGDFNGHAGPSGAAAMSAGGLPRYNYNTLTGQVAVKF